MEEDAINDERQARRVAEEERRKARGEEKRDREREREREREMEVRKSTRTGEEKKLCG